jgi:mRNA-degrading endonuclease toxin of MazEF toxin-antitoxin module
VAKRGEVLAGLRRIGFGTSGSPELFVVLQSDAASQLDTIVVAPLDEDGDLYAIDPLAVHVSSKEVGASVPHVVLVHMLASVVGTRFQRAPVGRLAPASMARIDLALRRLLRLP